MRTWLRVLTLPVLLILAVSCATRLAPGSDPVVVRAETFREDATDVVATFLSLEKAEHTAPGTASFLGKPEIHAFAQKLRGANCGIPDDAPDAQKLEMLASCPGTAYHTASRLTNAIEAYKLNRTPTGEADVTTWLNTLNSLLTTVRQYMGGGA